MSDVKAMQVETRFFTSPGYIEIFGDVIAM